MTLIRTTTTAMAAAALVFAAATTGVAQQPVRVQKESPGDVVISRVDTVYITRVDTVWRDHMTPAAPPRVDTIRITMVDTVFQDVPMIPEPLRFYWGLGGGGSFPQQHLDPGLATGFNATLLAGWRGETMPWGLRIDATYDQLQGRTINGTRLDNASVISGMADATFDVPWGVGRSGLYLVGGVGVHRLSDFSFEREDFIPGEEAPDRPRFITESSTDFGVNAGLGLRFGMGRSNLFVEGRWVNVFRGDQDVRYIPVVLGITF
ncbi:MAG TPA: hypothetical protein VMM18_02140 [Gemmatimonadaceae bacterium]|nr:hypothetical protein [Gemmatimonadaceae bacterium]